MNISTNHYVVYAHHDRPAVFRFSDAILQTSEPENCKVSVHMNRAAGSITLFSPENAEPDELSGQMSVVLANFTFVITVVGTDKLDKVKSPVLVKHKDLQQVVAAAVEQGTAAKVAAAEKEMQGTLRERDAMHEAELRKRDAKYRRSLSGIVRRQGEYALLREHTTAIETVEFARTDACRELGSLAVCPVHWSRLDSRAILRFEVFNGTSSTVTADKFKAFGQGSGENRAGAVQIDGKEPMERGKARLTLRSMERVMVAMIVRDARTVGQQVQLLVSGPGVQPAVRHIDLRPKPGEGLITLSLQGIAGAVWLANPVDPGQLGAATAIGLEMRVRYGINRLLSFEAALAGARSGNASWDGMRFNNQEGVIARDATLGRVLAGGVLHFGDKYRPLVRAGLGFQGVNHGSSFTPTGGAAEGGPASEFELAGLWSFGLGFEARITRQWTAGLGAMFVGVAKSTSAAGLETSFEGRFHLSYGWTP